MINYSAQIISFLRKHKKRQNSHLATIANEVLYIEDSSAFTNEEDTGKLRFFCLT